MPDQPDAIPACPNELSIPLTLDLAPTEPAQQSASLLDWYCLSSEHNHGLCLPLFAWCLLVGPAFACGWFLIMILAIVFTGPNASIVELRLSTILLVFLLPALLSGPLAVCMDVLKGKSWEFHHFFTGWRYYFHCLFVDLATPVLALACIAGWFGVMQLIRFADLQGSIRDTMGANHCSC